ncbi:MAG: cell division protein FtsZ [Desulfobacterales bacterium]|nr:cell division protein FtsZ [Desulfobacterales bacterium]MBF0396056.1 cell division protein FtsZ [Desulfobacterales bacterium]
MSDKQGEIFANIQERAKIKVIGVGGAGGNAINSMIEHNLCGVNFIAANTDVQSLEVSKAGTKIQLGLALTQGLGAGANPQIGREAAIENMDFLKESLKDSNMVFIAAGLGGGTGTGAAPVIAEVSKELGALTVAVVTRPFAFEGLKRSKVAEEGLESLRKVADTVITIPNDRLRGIAPKNAKMKDMFKRADEILYHSVRGITDLILNTGHVNADFADVKTTMSKSGMAIMGIGTSAGQNRALEAAQRAISHPLLEDVSIKGAKAVLMNITANSEVTIEEITEASDYIHNEAGGEVDVIWGLVFDDEVGDEMRITVIATGIGSAPDLLSRDRHERLRTKLRVEDIKYSKHDESRIITPYKKTITESPSYSDPFKGGDIDQNNLEIPTFLRRKAD